MGYELVEGSVAANSGWGSNPSSISEVQRINYLQQTTWGQSR